MKNAIILAFIIFIGFYPCVGFSQTLENREAVGILTDQGKGYLYVYNKTVDVLLDKGFLDKEEAESNRKSIKENIKSVG